MVKVVTVAQMLALEKAANQRGVSNLQMMETAGRAVAEVAKAMLAPLRLPKPRITVLVGPGNNGGDGLVAGRLLAAECDANVVFIMARPRDANTDPVFAQVSHLPTRSGRDEGAVNGLTAGADLIIDALLGTGAQPPLRGDLRELVQWVYWTIDAMITPPLPLVVAPSQWLSTPPQRPLLLAVDAPTGIDADSGDCDPLTFKADATVALEAVKQGLLAFPAAERVGKLYVAALGLPNPMPEHDSLLVSLLDADTVRSLLPKRPANSNKGSFGRVLVLGGSSAYVGAPALSGKAAYRVGAGLVSIAAPDTIIPMLAGQHPEITWLPFPDGQTPDEMAITDAAIALANTKIPDYDSFLIGPGLGRTFNMYGLLETVFNNAGGQFPPMIIDADGLNMLATMESWWGHLPARTILTPHPGEMARLTRLSIAEVQANRVALAQEKAALWRCIVVLKGAYTVVADPDGQAIIIPFADAALAKAGTGDVLAGAIAGLLAQGIDPLAAALSSAYLHGMAGQLAAAKYGARGLLASDVADQLGLAAAQLDS
jgi:ADP-dependent NAD(P)H-hydrate dehydratase / NAD(P)H-hydrate epimerase